MWRNTEETRISYIKTGTKRHSSNVFLSRNVFPQRQRKKQKEFVDRDVYLESCLYSRGRTSEQNLNNSSPRFASLYSTQIGREIESERSLAVRKRPSPSQEVGVFEHDWATTALPQPTLQDWSRDTPTQRCM